MKPNETFKIFEGALTKSKLGIESQKNCPGKRSTEISPALQINCKKTYICRQRFLWIVGNWTIVKNNLF